jgi:cell division protein DivIC
MSRQPDQANKTKTTYKGTRKRLRLLFFVLTCYFVWAGATMLDQQKKTQAHATQLVELQKTLENEQRLNGELKHEIKRLNDPEYIGQIARRDQNMYLPGETSINVTGNEP